MHTCTAVTMQLDQTSVRVDESFGEIMITIFNQGQSEINVSLQVDTRIDAATGKNNTENPTIHSTTCIPYHICLMFTQILE
jgi:P pilus assembly chaperone PapD